MVLKTLGDWFGRARAAAPSAAAKEGAQVSLTVNGDQHRLTVDHRVTLLQLLRHHLGLTGTKRGCDQGQCGACTVLVNGERILSCLALAVSHDGDEVMTIEGVDGPAGLHPLQAAFLREDAFQCGFCTPGQVCSALGMISEFEAGWPSAATPLGEPVHHLDAREIRERMAGNLCRCSAYPQIVSAIVAYAAGAR
jgi:xanthine dehydrogenase YagT iron-sulfur-binding subunit